MSRQVLFIQGGGENVHDAWDDKLVASLRRELGQHYEIHYPRMPNEDEPDYPKWKAAIGREMAKLGDGAILIGHSIGGTMLIHALAEEPPKMRPGAVLLLSAPFVGEGGWPSDDIAPKRDIGVRLAAGLPVHVFHGSEDEIAPPPHADLYGEAIKQAEIHRLPGRDHQLNNDLSEVAKTVKQLEWASVRRR